MLASNREKFATPDSERPKVIGLAGGIASGKSTVARMFEELGARVIDADVIARKLLETAAVCEKIRERWGEDLFDSEGRPDPSRIADIVFGNPQELAALNDLVHPATCREIRAELDTALQIREAPLIVIDAPLLFEAELDAWCDVTLFIVADLDSRLLRTRGSRGWTPEEMKRRESAQMELSEKRRRADAVINNNGFPEETRSQVKQFFRQWIRPVPSRNPQALHSGGKDDA